MKLLYERKREDARRFIDFLPILSELAGGLFCKRGGETDPVITLAADYLRVHMTEQTGMSELADMLHVSESFLYHRFRQEMKCSPIEYKNGLRIRAAIGMPADKTLSTSEIAERLGFSSNAYFLRMFRSITGKTTQYYRRDAAL